MTSPITSRPINNDLQDRIEGDNASVANSLQRNLKAEEESSSFWYLSSIKSLQASEVNTPIEAKSEKIGLPSQQKEPTKIERFTSWLWSLFGRNQAQEAVVLPKLANADKPIAVEPISHTPKLEAPESINNGRLSKAIADLNQHLLHRLKETAEFEAEMRKSNSHSMDRLILFHIIAKSLDQKKLKEEASLQAHEHIVNLQKLNKELSAKRYCAVEDVNADAKKQTLLHWVNIGTAVGIAGTLAAGFVTGGTNGIFAIALTTLNIVKGGFTFGEGMIKYRNDLRTGEITMFTHDMRVNRGAINDKVNTTLAYADEEISHLLKTIRHHLENYSKEARIQKG